MLTSAVIILKTILCILVASAVTLEKISSECPTKCDCLERYVECSKKNLGNIPRFPDWTERIDLSFNKFDTLADYNLTYLSNLKELKCNSCGFTRIPALYLPTLFESLHINKNKINTLQRGVTNIKSPVRILHLNNNEIKWISEDFFENWINLIELKLNKNNINHLGKEVFKSLTKLRILELNRNHLKNITSLVFKGLDHLDDLKLKHNIISIVTNGAFVGLKNIKVINLDYNRIKSISKGWMYGLESLKSLTVSHNAIEVIEHGSWEMSTSVEELDFSFNRLSKIELNTFEHLKNLKILNLADNKIISINHGSFTFTPSITELYLDNNKISWIIEDMSGLFSDLHHMYKLGLSSNQIKSINSKAFEGLENLKELDLNNNNITHIQENAFEMLTKMTKIQLDTNSMTCDCSLQWFGAWAQNIVHENITATCAYPNNLKGESVLKIDNKFCGDSPRPQIVEHPKAKLAIKGKSTTIKCAATSKPFSNITFTWKKNNAEVSSLLVTNQDEYKGQDVIAISILTIANVSRSNMGKYQCVATNRYGSTYSNKARVDIVTFPKFTMMPSNATVKTSETVSLKCAATGDPIPEISWKKDGGTDFPAASERRMHVMPADHIFFIVNAKAVDNGIYSCAAKNAAGVIIANVTLTVLEEPSFTKVTENKEANLGESAVLQCMTSGSPKPEVQWFKGETEIFQNEHFYFAADNQLLVILNVDVHDAGPYGCLISNKLGTKKSTTLLRITSSGSVIVKEKDITGIIIITVVACVVGTSIIWVVIICQTRRKLTNNTRNYATETISLSPYTMKREIGSPILSDTISEKSSCIDSGMGGSAKRNFDIVQSDIAEQINLDSNVMSGSDSYSPTSVHPPSTFKPIVNVCVNNTISTNYSFPSRST